MVIMGDFAEAGMGIKTGRHDEKPKHEAGHVRYFIGI